jgi:HEAT repeat protein
VRLQWTIMGGASLLAAGFMVYLMCKLAAFEGHRSTLTKRVEVQETRAGEGHVPSRVDTSGPDPKVSRVNLRRLLLRFQRAPQPARRARVLEQIGKRIDELEPHLLDILVDEHDPLVVPAIAVVGALEVKASALALMLLADSDRTPVRLAAIRAKENLDPWGFNHLQEFLTETDPELLLTVIEIVQQRDDRPVPELTTLLRHPRAAVRKAAGEAMPALAPGPDLAVLCRMAEAASGRDSWAAAHALGRPHFSTDAEACLFRLLESSDRVLRRTALQALGNKGAKLENIDPILRVIRDESRTLNERAAAFLTLERTRSTPAARLTELSANLHPILQFHAARCLAVAGDRSAIRILIDLLDTTESKAVSFGQRQYVISESRDYLRQISTVDLGAESAPWRRWQRENPDLTPLSSLHLPAKAW